LGHQAMVALVWLVLPPCITGHCPVAFVIYLSFQ